MNEIARKVITVDPDFAAIWGKLEGEAYEGLKAEIKADGIRDPLVIWNPNNNHILIDGHNRLRIAEELHIHAIPVVYKVFKDKAETAQWIFSHQIQRRNVTDGQRVIAMQAMQKCFADAARKNLGGDHRSEEFQKSKWENSPNLKNKEETRTRTKLAKEVGLTEWKARQGEYVLKHATDDQKEDLRTGKKDLKEVFKETVRANAPKKDDIVRKYEQIEEATRQDGKTVDIQKAKMHKQAEDFLEKQKASDAYDIIYNIIRESRKLTDEMIEVYKKVYSEKGEQQYLINARSVWDAGQRLIKLGEWTQEVNK